MSDQSREADITVSGVTLTPGQSMTIRVALQNFASTLTEHGLGNDKHGRFMKKAYMQSIREVNALILQTAR